jgi:hypothetical protein
MSTATKLYLVALLLSCTTAAGCWSSAAAETPTDSKTSGTARNAGKGSVRMIYVKIADGRGQTDDQTGEGPVWTCDSIIDTPITEETRNYFRVDSNRLTQDATAAVAEMMGEGYRILQIVPISRGYSRTSQGLNQHDHGGYGYGVSPTDGILVVGIR